MANGTKAIERNEEQEKVVRRGVSNPLRPQHAFAEWLGSNFVVQALENEPITISGS
ncbi:hypothetical protein NKH89_31100 [Mesorhizobium sp. M0923]|uniref:hypothetical protein n=1 Tax=unclassified Mesorhizobium TaxID=325217 RepID=UPI00333D3724